jgi:trimeric autotransporter adhesin
MGIVSALGMRGFQLFLLAWMAIAGCGGRSERSAAGGGNRPASGSGSPSAAGTSGSPSVGGSPGTGGSRAGGSSGASGSSAGGSLGIGGSPGAGGSAGAPSSGAAGAPNPACASDAECRLGCSNGRCISPDTLDAYIKASNSDGADKFGVKIALSADGSTLAVGAFSEDSAAAGIDGDQDDNAAEEAGAAYVFRRAAKGWAQEAYIKAANSGAQDRFGISLALSGDGTLLVVGASGESSAARGINGDATNNLAAGSGAAYAFRRSAAGTWSQEAYIKASNSEAGDGFGYVALSADGGTLVVAALAEDSAATGVDGDQADNSVDGAAALYVFRHGAGDSWTQEAYLKRDHNTGGTAFGGSLALSADGSLLAAGSFFEDAGAVYVFHRGAGGGWSQEARLTPPLPNPSDGFGTGLDLSGDGLILAVGSPLEDSPMLGISEAEIDMGPGGAASGAAYVFRRGLDGTWSQEAFIKASNSRIGQQFGRALALSGDGLTLAAGSLDDSSAPGIGGDENDSAARDSGAVYVIRQSEGTWRQVAYVKAPNPEPGDYFGCESIDLSADGDTLAVGASAEASGARGIGGDQTDNSAASSGAVYVYR